VWHQVHLRWGVLRVAKRALVHPGLDSCASLIRSQLSPSLGSCLQHTIGSAYVSLKLSTWSRRTCLTLFSPSFWATGIAFCACSMKTLNYNYPSPVRITWFAANSFIFKEIYISTSHCSFSGGPWPRDFGITEKWGS